MEHHKNIRGVTETDAPSTSFEEMREKIREILDVAFFGATRDGILHDKVAQKISDLLTHALTAQREEMLAEIEKLNFAGHGDGGVYDDYGKGYFGAIKDIINLLTTPE
jgi:hypothetical protein